MLKVLHEDRRSVKVVHRHVEITLDLRGVQVKRQSTAGPGCFQQVRDKLRRDRHARLVFAILARIAVIRQHGGDTPCGSAFESVNHQQKFKQVVVHRIVAGLYHEDISAAHVFQNLKINFAIAEAPEHSFAQRHIQIPADSFGKHWIRGTREYFETLVVQGRFPLSVFSRLQEQRLALFPREAEN
jgi:hypothetical protein